MKKYIQTKHHNLLVMSISQSELPAGLDSSDKYKTFYAVRNGFENGHIFLYLAKGNPDAPGEIVAWYPNTKSMWSGYGTSIERAVAGAFEDAFKYA